MSFGLARPVQSTILGQQRAPQPGGIKTIEGSKVDLKVEGLRGRLPEKPYLLRVRNAPNFRLNEDQARNWAAGTPFGPGEEHCQYMSYLHRNPRQGLLYTDADWDYKHEGPKPGVIYKKISLDAYRTRKAAELAAAKVEHGSSEAGAGSAVAPASMTSAAPSASAPAPPPEPVPQGAATPERDQQARTPRDLSPLRYAPSPEDERMPYGGDFEAVELGPLSPTLPAIVMKKLAGSLKPRPRETGKSGKSGRPVVKEPPRTEKGYAQPTSSSLAKKGPASKPAASTARVGVSQAPAPAPAPVPIPIQPNARRGGAVSFFEGLNNGYQMPSPAVRASTVVKVGKAPASAGAAAPDEKTSASEADQVLRLKYGKNNQKNVERLLNTKPAPGKAPPAPEAGAKRGRTSLEEANPSERAAKRQRGPEPSKNEEKKRAPTEASQKGQKKEPKAGEKRARAAVEDDQPSDRAAKKQKAPALVEAPKKPRTPVPASFRSPAAPGKEAKGVAMRRMESAESHASTPQGVKNDAGVGPRRASAERAAEKVASAPSADSKKEIEARKAEFGKYSELGRKIKHQAEYVWNRSSADGEGSGSKEGAAMGLQSICCYILAFHAQDEGLRLQGGTGDVKSWRSIIPLWNFVERHCRPFPCLHGLCLQVGAICCEAIQSLDLLGTSTTSAADKSSNAAFLRRLWLDGTSKLSIDDLQDKFPKTWSRRVRTPKEVCETHQGFYLPLSSITGSVEAVRATTALINEWAAAEMKGVKWDDGRLGL